MANPSNVVGGACPWCGHVNDLAARACRGCGAAITAAPVADESGWIEMPGAKDLAELQFGRSNLQIAGKVVPVADFNLAEGDDVYFAHHQLLWKDPRVQVITRSLKGGWKRLFAGMPLVMVEAKGPGHIAFSRDVPGELVAVPLDVGQEIDVREHVFMVASGSVAYDWFPTGVWYRTQNGDETEMHYPMGMFMDRFSAPARPGLLLLHGAGNLFTRTLQPGETLYVRPRALVYKSSLVSMHLVIQSQQLGVFTGFLSYLWLQLRGPGKVAIQSADKHHEEHRQPIVATSGSYASF